MNIIPTCVDRDDTVFLLLAFTLYFCLAFILPTVRVWRQTGKNPYFLPMSDDAYGFVSRCMKMLIGALFVYFSVQLWLSQSAAYTGAFPQSAVGGMRVAGWVLLAVVIFWTLIAQYQMGKSWRIGIDTSAKTELITRGLFAWSRNPIFLAMRVCLLALLMIQPNAVTLVFFLVGDLVMQFQVRLEEAFLSEQHGMDYANYCRAVRRWL